MFFERSEYQSKFCPKVCRHIWEPVGRPRGLALFVPGLGDHGGRHWRHLRLFAEHGIAGIALDLPGHGRSEGKRGYVANLGQVFGLIGEGFEYLQGEWGAHLPIGIMGQSMGGFFALNYLADARRDCDFAWISSTLVDARKKVRPYLRGHLYTAWLGSRRSLPCGTGSAPNSASAIRKGSLRRMPMNSGHTSISASLASTLMLGSKLLLERLRRVDPNVRVLYTHGGADVICPAEDARRAFEAMPCTQKEFALFEDLLHEPFNDVGREAVFETLSRFASECAASGRASSAGVEQEMLPA